MYYYASRDDKDNNRLMTSYGNAASQKKYGGADARLFNGVVVMDTESEEFAELADPNKYDFESELLIRSRIHNPDPSGSNGKFVLYKLEKNKWVETEFRCGSYGAANTLMKALVSLYGDLIVVEETESVSKASSSSAGF